jgi:hypothetical protein
VISGTTLGRFGGADPELAPPKGSGFGAWKVGATYATNMVWQKQKWAVLRHPEAVAAVRNAAVGGFSRNPIPQ